MQYYLVDTNIFLKSLFNEKEAEICEKFLKDCYDEAIPLVVTSFTLHSIEVMMLKRGKSDALYSFLKKLTDSKNILIYTTDAAQELKILEFSRQGKMDFDDSFQYYAAKDSNCEAIISYDSDFDDLDIKRRTPEDFIR